MAGSKRDVTAHLAKLHAHRDEHAESAASAAQAAYPPAGEDSSAAPAPLDLALAGHETRARPV